MFENRMAEGRLQLRDFVHFGHLYEMELGSQDYQNGQGGCPKDWYCVEKSPLHHQHPREVRN